MECPRGARVRFVWEANCFPRRTGPRLLQDCLLWFLLDFPMNDLRTFTYVNDHTLNYWLCNQVPNKGQEVLPVKFLSGPGLPGAASNDEGEFVGMACGAGGCEQDCRGGTADQLQEPSRRVV
jgi:hypothetical protein